MQRDRDTRRTGALDQQPRVVEQLLRVADMDQQRRQAAQDGKER